MDEKENGKVYKDNYLTLFVIGSVRKMQNWNFLVCYVTFPRKKVFLVGVRWFLFFSVIVFKSQITLREAVSEEDVK